MLAWGKTGVASHWHSRKGGSLPNVSCEPNCCHLKSCTNDSDTATSADIKEASSQTTLNSRTATAPFVLESRGHTPAKIDGFPSDILVSELSTPSSSIIAPSRRIFNKAVATPGHALPKTHEEPTTLLLARKTSAVESDTPTASDSEALAECSEDSDANSERFPSSMEESFHDLPDCSSVPSCAVENTTAPEEKSLDSTCSMSYTGGKTGDSGDDSGYGLYLDGSVFGSPQYEFDRVCGIGTASEFIHRGCTHCGSTTTYLSKEISRLKKQCTEKDAMLTRLKELVEKQVMEKEDLLQQRNKSETDLKSCEQQLESVRNSELRFRESYFHNAAELNTLQREVMTLRGEVTSRKIFANKLHAEMMQSNNRNQCRATLEKEKTTFQSHLEEQTIRHNQDLERTVLLLEKRMEILQDDTEDMHFKAQRHAKEAASLTSQNAKLVKQCGDLQRQLVECLATINVLDVRSSDAESKLNRARLTLEKKENDLCRMSSERTAALLKIEKNERELERVRNEIANVTRNFMKLSDNQRELKERLVFCKEMVEARDTKIDELMEERSHLLFRLERQSAEESGDITPISTSEPLQLLTRKPADLWNGQTKALEENLSEIDIMLSEQIITMKQENEGLNSEVQMLRKELNSRCSNSISRMVQIMETIEQLEEDMGEFLEHRCQAVDLNKSALSSRSPSLCNQADREPRPEPKGEQESARLIKENLHLTQSLAKVKLEVDALLLANTEMEERLKKQDLSEKAQQLGAKRLEQSDLKTVSIEPVATPVQEENGKFRDYQTFKANLNSELTTHNDSSHEDPLENWSIEKNNLLEVSQHLWKIPPDICHAVDVLSLSAGDTVDELNRISVFLQISLLKTKGLVSRGKPQHECYLAVISGLESVLLNVRNVILFEKNPEEADKLVELTACGIPEGEPNLLHASRTELEGQIASARRDIQLLRKALASSEEERRQDQQRHKSQLFDLVSKFRLRLKERETVSVRNAEPVIKRGSKEEDQTSSKSQHSVCRAFVVNLDRDLRASRQSVHKLQDEITTKDQEARRLNQQILALRSDVYAMHDILDNKKIALGRSEAIGQVLRVSGANLVQRLELEQRQHEDCRQQLDRNLDETRMKAEEMKELRHQLFEKDGELSAVHRELAHITKEYGELYRLCQKKDEELNRTRNRVNTLRCDGPPSKEYKMEMPEIGADAVLGKEFRSMKSAISSPLCIDNKAELLALIERARPKKSDVMGQLQQSVSHMTKDVHFLVRHFMKEGKDD